MTSLDDFLPYVLTDCPGCSDSMALVSISSALIEFCHKSLIIVRDHDPVDVKTGVNDYDLDSPINGMLVCKVMQAWYMGRKLIATPPDDMDDPTIYNPAALQQAVSGAVPTHYIQKDERSISLWRTPNSDADRALTMRVALKPMRAATSVDDVLFEDWIDVIAAGAKASIMITPQKTFTNPQMASVNQAEFVAGINRAIARGNKGHTRANLSVRMRNL